MVLLTTEAVRPVERFAYWREVVSQHFVHLRPDQVVGGLFHGKIWAKSLGGVGVSQVTSGRQRVFRIAADIARSPAPLYFMNIQVAGAGSFRQGGVERETSRGDIFFVDPLREFELGCERPFRHVSLKLPREWIDARLARREWIQGASIPAAHPLARLIGRYVATAFDIADSLPPAAAAMMAEHVVDLVAQALRDDHLGDVRSTQARRAAVFMRACHTIALRFADPELTTKQIADDAGVSARFLQLIFAEQGTSVSRRIFDERIRHAAKLLSDPQATHRSVTDIAFASGFNDSSHFGRVFSARMSMTPSQWRKQTR
jgi:AraC family transcriptional regulator, positive regulator of tynA and feaB